MSNPHRVPVNGEDLRRTFPVLETVLIGLFDMIVYSVANLNGVCNSTTTPLILVEGTFEDLTGLRSQEQLTSTMKDLDRLSR
jgi:hypothetical protein